MKAGGMMGDELERGLGKLRLRRTREQLCAWSEEAAKAKMSYVEFLEMVVARELEDKEATRRVRARQSAKFPYPKTLDDFEWEAAPSVDQAKVRELSACRWVANGQNILLLGPPGVGKTHLAVGLGHEAIKRGMKVKYVEAAVLMSQLVEAQERGELENALKKVCAPHVLIVDELGYLPLEKKASHLFFQVIARRYEKGSVVMTSNRDVSEWGEVFGDAVVATAILDRLLHHSHVLTIRGESYRLREKRRSGLIKPGRVSDPDT